MPPPALFLCRWLLLLLLLLLLHGHLFNPITISSSPLFDDDGNGGCDGDGDVMRLVVRSTTAVAMSRNTLNPDTGPDPSAGVEASPDPDECSLSCP